MVQKLQELLKTNNVLLTGGGGVGKSYLSSELVSKMKKEAKQVIVLGSTGVSAVNVNGQTIHSFFAFGICNSLDELKRHDRYVKSRIKELNKMLYNADLLVIDEISMVSASMMDMIKMRLQVAKFSGAILFVGDFFQLPPIQSAKNNYDLFNEVEFAFESSSWEYFSPVIVELTTTKRTDDKEFFTLLSFIRKGEYSKEIDTFLQKLRQNTHVLEKNPTILFGTNKQVDQKNLQKLKEIDSEEILLPAKEKLHVSSLHENKVKSWKNALPIPARLVLKQGALVLFCTNKWGSYYNGERGVVKNIDEEFVHVEKQNGQIVKVTRQEYTLNENIILNNEITDRALFSLEQFPLKLAYAITIHKSQGMSIDTLVCNVDNIFEKSQFYVAISRAKNPKNLMIEFLRKNIDFSTHLQRCIQVSPKVSSFYQNADIIHIEEEQIPTLF
jgi:ATP-dependent exoDNAse (exonuclease V) alpha subunit